MTVGLVAGTLLALVGGTLALMQPARREGKLSDAARVALTAVAKAVIGPLLPQAAEAQAAALQAHVGRVEATIATHQPQPEGWVADLQSWPRHGPHAPARPWLVLQPTAAARGLSRPWPPQSWQGGPHC